MYVCLSVGPYLSMFLCFCSLSLCVFACLAVCVSTVPTIVLMGDGSVLLAFWCEEDGLSVIRQVRLEVS